MSIMMGPCQKALRSPQQPPSSTPCPLETTQRRRESWAWSPGSLLLAASLALALLAVPGQAAETLYSVSYQRCIAPPEVIVERTGAVTQAVFSLCMKTFRGLSVDFDNADKFFIGNKSTFIDFGTACFDLEKVFLVAPDESQPGKHTFLPAGGLPGEFAMQAWDLTLWTSYDPESDQKVNLTVSNFGPSNLQFTGLNLNDLNLPEDYKFTQGNVTTLELEFSKVDLTYYSLPILQEYLLAPDTSIGKGITAIALIQLSPNPGQTYVNVTYALVQYDPGNPTDEWNFLLYESTYTPPSATNPRGRRLLVAAPTQKSPAAACSGGACRPASPLPKTCVPRGSNYPACLKTCGCFTKKKK